MTIARTVAPLLIALATLPLPLQAQDTRKGLETRLGAEFKRWDVDGNGSVTRAEAQKAAGRPQKGLAVPPEQARALAALWFLRTDGNGDGKVTLAESRAMLRQTFARVDRDGNGTISPAERKAAQAALKSGRAPGGR